VSAQAVVDTASHICYGGDARDMLRICYVICYGGDARGSELLSCTVLICSASSVIDHHHTCAAGRTVKALADAMVHYVQLLYYRPCGSQSCSSCSSGCRSCHATGCQPYNFVCFTHGGMHCGRAALQQVASAVHRCVGVLLQQLQQLQLDMIWPSSPLSAYVIV
jgi:hypothetical protein